MLAMMEVFFESSSVNPIMIFGAKWGWRTIDSFRITDGALI